MSQPDHGWPTTPPPHRPLTPRDPDAVGPYRLEAVLGAGGMGRVYLGRTPAGAAVAVKLVHREYAEDKAFRKRFEQEVATARRVHGLYTVPVVDADTDADEPWLATAYVPGPSLQDAVAEHGPLPAEVAVRLVAGVAEALESIHAAGVIHRDLKPSNVILTAEGPKVIDFGIARAVDLTSITGTGAMPGTPAYMAPEQILGQTITPAADVFALGILTNFAATGQLAFAGESLPAVIHRILQQEPELDGCPEPLSSIATACLDKDPGRRPTPTQIIQLCSGKTAAPRPAPTQLDAPVVPPQRTELDPRAASGPRPVRRSLLLAAGLAGVVGLVIAAIALVPDTAGDRAGAVSPDTTSPTTTSPRAIPTVRPAATLRPRDTHYIESVAFSPNGRTLAYAADATVKLRNMASGKQRAIVTDHTSTIGEVVFSPNGRTLATASSDDTARLWDVASGQRRATLRHTDFVFGVAFSPDGRTVATASHDETVRLWNVATGRQRATLTRDTYGVAEVVFSPDGRTLAAASGDETVQLWDVASGKERVLTAKVGIDNVAFSPDGNTLAAATKDGPVQLWDVASGKESAALTGHTSYVSGVAFSPDGRTVASASADKTVRLWDVASRQQSATLSGHTGWVSDVAFSPDGRMLASAANDTTARLWKIPD
jgi:WD40 repeat protein/serine/threonine protein kinase